MTRPEDAERVRLPMGRRPENERGNAIWLSGRWRSPAGVEALRERWRIRERARRAAKSAARKAALVPSGEDPEMKRG